jgi:hypothetical protein
MAIVRNPTVQRLPQNQGKEPQAGQDHGGSNAAVAHLGARPSKNATTDSQGRGGQGQNYPGTEEIRALANQLGKVTPTGVARVVGDVARNRKPEANIPWDNPLNYIGPKAVPAAFQLGSLRRPLFSQPLPAELRARGRQNCGIFISPQLREKIKPYLKNRPKRGFGYIISKGDVLDDLLDEAYSDGEGEGRDDEQRMADIIAAFLIYNRHLGLTDPEALQAAIGQLLFFPELHELLSLTSALAHGVNPTTFPAIESFLQVAGMPPSAAKMFHWVAPRLPATDANLTTFGKPFAFQSEGYTMRTPHDPVSSDIPETWVKQQIEAGMYRAHVNRDHQYNEDLLVTGRYNHVRG